MLTTLFSSTAAILDVGPLEMLSRTFGSPGAAEHVARHALQSLDLSGATIVCIPAACCTAVAEAQAEALGSVMVHVQCEKDLDCFVKTSQRFPSLRKILIDYPAQVTTSTMIYRQKFEDICSDKDTLLDTCVSNELAEVTAYMRGALGCKYNGKHIQTIQLGECMSRILALGSSMVILEEGARGLTPRWTDTVIKTFVAMGGPIEQVGLSLSSNDDLSCAVIRMALVGGTHFFVGSSLQGMHDLPLVKAQTSSERKQLRGTAAPTADARIRIDEILAGLVNVRELQDAATEEEFEFVQQSTAYCQSLQKVFP